LTRIESVMVLLVLTSAYFLLSLAYYIVVVTAAFIWVICICTIVQLHRKNSSNRWQTDPERYSESNEIVTLVFEQ